MINQFINEFQALTGHAPLPWQQRLFSEHFVKNDLPHVIDLPTGLGKTMVMAIWLIARRLNSMLPRRLIYVVDRRTVVDQATDLAAKLREATNDREFAVSTLRGQLADNREWSRDPSRPAIIIGTVDLIGSALLFSGYRSSFKRRPLEAGLLGQDSLIVLDEAQLSKPFEELVKSIFDFQANQGSPMRVIRMSATSGNSNDEKVFRLDTDPNSSSYDLKADPDPVTSEERNQIITRFRAEKQLSIKPLAEKKDINRDLAKNAVELAENDSLIGKRIVVFVRSPEDAKAIAKAICDHGKPSKSKANPEPKGPFADFVEVLTGTMRGLERDKLVEKPVFKDRWLNGELDPTDPINQHPVFLISTSAGEVGFDLNADHMVCDAAPIDSMIQRLGRVNRRGRGNATIQLIPETIKTTDKAGKVRNIERIEKSIFETLELLKGVTNVSPQDLAELKKTEKWKSKYAQACSPEPIMVELTDILLDAWSMTSVTEPMPARPEVAPWLRGIADQLAQTTIAWRAELDHFKDMPNATKALKAIFTKHRIRAHESLTTNSYRIIDFLKVATSGKNGRPELRKTQIAIKFARDVIVTTIGDLIDNPGPLFADPTLILPASFEGLDQNGMLSGDAISPIPDPDDPTPSLDIADEPGYETREDTRPRIRILIERNSGGWKAIPLPGGASLPADLEFNATFGTSAGLFKAIAKTGLRVRLVQPISIDVEGEPIRSLVLLAPVGDKTKNVEQLLSEHVGAVETQARQIAKDLDLKEQIRAALLFAAKWHDEGKKAAIWQRFIGCPEDSPPLGKAATICDARILHGYRHEFGSLLRIHHPERHTTNCELPDDLDTRDLALHLIATHHGCGRPHFSNPSDRDFQTTQCDAVHADVIRRFARVQRKYGWWRLAWLENLLRCADALASADQDAEDDPADSEGGVA